MKFNLKLVFIQHLGVNIFLIYQTQLMKVPENNFCILSKYMDKYIVYQFSKQNPSSVPIDVLQFVFFASLQMENKAKYCSLRQIFSFIHWSIL